MTRAAVPLLIYACLAGALAGVLRVWDSDPLPSALLAGAALAMAAIGGLSVANGRRLARGEAMPELRAVPDLSAATALLGFAIPTLLVGLYLGLYLVLIGGGVALLALGGLVREALAVRRATGRGADGR